MFKSVFVQKLNLSTCLTKLRLTASHKMFKISGPVKRSKTLASTSVKLQYVSMSQWQTALKLHTIKLSNLKWTWRFRLYVPSNCHKMLERLGILRNTVNHDYGGLRSPRSRSLPATAMVVIRCAISNHEQPKNNLHNHSRSQSRVAKASLLNNLISAWANKRTHELLVGMPHVSQIYAHELSLLPALIAVTKVCGEGPEGKAFKKNAKICLSFSHLFNLVFYFPFFLMLRASAIPSEGTKLISGKCRRWASAKSNISGQWIEACETSRTSFWTFWINCLLFTSIAPSDASLGSCFQKMKFSMKHLQEVAWGESRMHLSWNILPVK